MADLDDFFAKKDKKKSKTKKFTTLDQVAKKMEDTSKKPLDNKPKKDKDKIGFDGENNSMNNQEDDEWKEFEEEKKDYSNLKIQNLELNETEESEETGADEDSEEGDRAEGGSKKPSGPWNKPSSNQERQEPNVSDEDSPPPSEKPPTRRPAAAADAKETSSYVPPHMRNQSSAAPMPFSSSRARTKAAPDITNESNFPTLSAAATNEPVVGPWGRK